MSGVAWTRVEISTRSTGLEPGLQARIADPLWMLARQWQLGELKGEDAGGPVSVKLTVRSSPLSSWGPGAKPSEDDPRPRPLSAGTPLEALVEAEPTSGATAFRLSAEAGQQLLRMLDARSLGGYRAALRGAFPLVGGDVSGLDAAGTRRLRLLERTSLDGAKLFARLRSEDEAALGRRLKVAPADQATFVEVVKTWRTWYDSRHIEGQPATWSWHSDRMEYAFRMAAPGAESNVVLRAEGYGDGHLDWEDFDVAKETFGIKVASSTKTVGALPARVRFRGMPARRFWEMEDARIYFGGIEAGPLDLSKLVLAEFATVYGDDWFIVPLSLSMGALHRLESLVVTDTFGGTTTIPAAAVKDGASRPWRFFELEGDPGPAQKKAPWLLLPPALGQVQEGGELERVVMARDEQANLAWAIEEVIEDGLGRGLSRRDQTLRARARLEAEEEAAERDRAASGAPTAEGGGAASGAQTAEGGGAVSGEQAAERDRWIYRLEQDPPPWWIPLVPVQLKEKPDQFALRRGRMASWDSLPDALQPGPRGVVLEPGKPLRIFEEEVPAEGIEVTRSWQLARTGDGRLVMWVGRRKRPARKTHGSGLRFDQLQRGGK